MRGRWLTVGATAAVVAGILAGAAHAGADPQDDVPFCSGDMTPIDDYCQPSANQVYNGNAPGADPSVPIGVDPTYGPQSGSG